MQEVITKTIVILVALAAVVWFYNRLTRKKGGGGCGCGCSGCESDPADCAGCDQQPKKPSAEETTKEG